MRRVSFPPNIFTSSSRLISFMTFKSLHWLRTSQLLIFATHSRIAVESLRLIRALCERNSSHASHHHSLLGYWRRHHDQRLGPQLSQSRRRSLRTRLGRFSGPTRSQLSRF